MRGTREIMRIIEQGRFYENIFSRADLYPDGAETKKILNDIFRFATALYHAEATLSGVSKMFRSPEFREFAEYAGEAERIREELERCRKILIKHQCSLMKFQDYKMPDCSE